MRNVTKVEPTSTAVMFTNDEVSTLRGGLFDAITLLHAARDNIDNMKQNDEFTGNDSRASSLVYMADAKVKEVLKALLDKG